MGESRGPQGDWGRRLEALFGLLAALCLFAMMGLTFYDVGARYFFNRPVGGSLELTELLLVGLIFTGLPLVSRNDEHVAIDLLDQRLSSRLRAHLRRLVDALCALLLFGLALLLYRKAGQLASYGDETAVLKIALAPFVHAMSGLSFLAGAIHAAKALRRR